MSDLKEYFMILAWGECPFCVKAKALLLQEGYEFEYIVLDHAPTLLKNYNLFMTMEQFQSLCITM